MMALDLKEKISCIWHFAIPVFHPKPPKWQHFVKDSEYQQAMHLYIQMRNQAFPPSRKCLVSAC